MKMINSFTIKCFIAKIYDIIGISDRKIDELSRKYNGNYIRIINYHHVSNPEMFSQQLQYYTKHFKNVNYQEFESFLNKGTLTGDKPGIILSFDDGYEDNYSVALRCLEMFGFTGWFMVSSDLVGTNGYMDSEQLQKLLSVGHVIGDHTATHHRMKHEDTEQLLEYEIVESKEKLEKMLNTEIKIFCWCGGEEEHYTAKAAKIIRSAGYKYGFMTNSYPVVAGNNPFHIQRINVEDSWPLSLVKLQISGFMDRRFEKKRLRVDSETK